MYEHKRRGFYETKTGIVEQVGRLSELVHGSLSAGGSPLSHVCCQQEKGFPICRSFELLLLKWAASEDQKQNEREKRHWIESLLGIGRSVRQRLHRQLAERAKDEKGIFLENVGKLCAGRLAGRCS